MNEEIKMMANQRLKCNAALNYDEISSAGPPVLPLDFPTPNVRNADYFNLQVRDHRTQKVCEVLDVIVPLPQRPRGPQSERAYMVKKKIAKSTYGSVHLCIVLRRLRSEECDPLSEEECYWESTDEIVAIKASSWAKIHQHRGKHLEDPVKEAAALQHVGSYHPNILGCLEVLQDGDYLYTVMPYAMGGDLYGLVTRKGGYPPDESKARACFSQLLQGLYHLQKKGVCHRDISLENLLLDKQNKLVIIDLGLALRVPYNDGNNLGAISDVSEGTSRRLIRAQGQGGNLTYLAPEIIERAAFDGFAVDLWAAGVVLFILIVGMAPFQWAHPSDTRFHKISNGHLREVVRHLPISAEACDLLQNMLWRDTHRRLTLSQVMNHSWVLNRRRNPLMTVRENSASPTRRNHVAPFRPTSLITDAFTAKPFAVGGIQAHHME